MSKIETKLPAKAEEKKPEIKEKPKAISQIANNTEKPQEK
jgi:hypothetical protein